MSDTFRLVHDTARRLAQNAIVAAPDGWVVTLKEPTRNTEQNAYLHKILSEIAKQVEWHGRKLSLDTWKRLCTAAWLRELGESPEMIPALDGHGFDVIFEKTSKLTIKQCASLIDWCSAFAAEHHVVLPARTYTGEER